MAEQIRIAQLDVDVSALIRSTSEVKSAIDAIRKQQADLTRQGQTSSNQFVQNAADLRSLTTAYNANLRAISDSTQAQADQANRGQLLNLVLQQEVVSIKEAREQNSILNRLRNEANATTAEGQEEIRLLNAQLDRNNEFIRENADAYLQQKINIGNYTESIKEAAASMNPFNGGLSGFISRSQEAGGVMPLLTNGIKAVTSGVFGLIKASLAFIATPLGAVIAAIALVVGILYNVFKAFTPIVDKVEQAFAALSAVFSVVKNAIIGLVTGAKSLGEAFGSLAGDTAKAVRAAIDLKKAQQDLEDALKQQEVQSARNRAEINRLNIQAKDRTKSDEERIALLKQSEALEKKDFEQRKKNSDEAVRQAYEQIRIDASLTDAEFKELKKRGIAYLEYVETKASAQDENFDKLKEALIAETEIQNEYYSNQEKNINKQNKLIEDAEIAREKAREEAIKRQEEAEERRAKILDEAAKKSQLELDLFLSNQGIKAKSLEEELKLAETIYQKKLEINKKEFEASDKTANDKLELQIKNNDAQNELLQSQSDLVISNAQNELDQFIKLNQSKIDANKFLTDEIVSEEKARNERILQEQLDFEATKLQNGVITQQAYNQAINDLNEANRLKNVELDKQREQAAAEKKLIDLENQRIADNASFEEKLAFDLAKLEREREQELKAAEKTGADKNLINQKYENQKLAITKATKEAELSLTSQTLSQIKGLLKDNTVVSKALGIAEATINTYLGATKALATLPPPYGAIQAGVTIATGLAQVAKISDVKLEKGGIVEIGGKRHSQGGTKFYGEDGTTFEAERGEGIGVLNRSAFASFMNYNNQFNGGRSTPTFMQGGGIITQSVRPNTFDTDALVVATVQAVRELPPTYVTVEDIRSGVNSYSEVVDMANF